jgi:hypothetical protein
MILKMESIKAFKKEKKLYKNQKKLNRIKRFKFSKIGEKIRNIKLNQYYIRILLFKFKTLLKIFNLINQLEQ